MGDPRPCLCQVPAAIHPPSQKQMPVGSSRAIRTPHSCWMGRLSSWESQPRSLLLSGQGCSCPEGGIVLESWDLGLSPAWSRAGFESGPGMAWGQPKSLAELPPSHVFRVGGIIWDG